MLTAALGLMLLLAPMSPRSAQVETIESCFPVPNKPGVVKCVIVSDPTPNLLEPSPGPTQPSPDGEGSPVVGPSTPPEVDDGVADPSLEKECNWAPRKPQPPAGDPLWEGNDPAAGLVFARYCNGLSDYRFAPVVPGEPVAPPPPDPRDLAEQAIDQIRVPVPVINLGPDDTKVAVNVWTWLWLDQAAPLSITVEAGGVSVTATATLDSVTWTTGEPAKTNEAWPEAAGTPVTCSGAGSPPIAGYESGLRPPCGYVFRSRSTPERTGGSGTWPITATSTWAVSWASNTGVAGATTLTSTATDQVAVGEWATYLVGEGN